MYIWGRKGWWPSPSFHETTLTLPSDTWQNSYDNLSSLSNVSVLLRYSYTLQYNTETAFCFPFVFMDHRLWWREVDFSSSDSRPCCCCVSTYTPQLQKFVLLFSRSVRLFFGGHGWANLCSSCVRLFELQNTVVEVLPFYPATWISSHLLFFPLFFFSFFYQDNKYT